MNVLKIKTNLSKGLFFHNGSSWVQYGIMSLSIWSRGYTTPYRPPFALYTNVRVYRDWIDDIVHIVTKSESEPSKKRSDETKISLDCIYEFIDGPSTP